MKSPKEEFVKNYNTGGKGKSSKEDFSVYYEQKYGTKTESRPREMEIQTPQIQTAKKKSGMTKQEMVADARIEKEKRESQFREERERGKYGFQKGIDFLKYEDMPNNSDYSTMMETGKSKYNLFQQEDSYGLLDYFNPDKRKILLSTENNYTYMNDTEKELYYYLNGKYGAKEASDYVESINEELNKRGAETVTKNAEKFGKESPALGLALNSMVHVGGSGAGPIKYIKNEFSKGKKLDPNDPLFGTDFVREGTVAGITENDELKRLVPDDNIRRFGTDLAVSMGENIARLPLGKLGLVSAASGAGLSGTRDALQRGIEDDKAIQIGVANAVAEAFFEKFSLEGLEKFKTVKVKTVKDFLRNMGKQAFTEGSEEAFTEIANEITDLQIAGALSNYNLEVNGYLSQGISSEEAKAKAFQTFLNNVVIAGVGGGISGGVMGGGVMGFESAVNYTKGKNINPDYRDYAYGLDEKKENFSVQKDYQHMLELQEEAKSYAERQKNGEFISNHEKGRFQRDFDAYNRNRIIHEMQQEQQNKNIEKSVLEKQNGQEQDLQTEPETKTEFHNQMQNQNTDEGIELWGKVYGKQGKSAFQEAYDGKLGIEEYYRGFSQYYNAGRYNMDLSMDKKAEISYVLTPEQAERAYKAGAQDRNIEIGYHPETYQMRNMVKGEEKTGGLEYAVETATEEQKKVADTFGKRTGLKFYLVDEVEDGVSASYGKGEIKISVNSKNFNAAVSHELTHFIQDYAPDLYQLYQDTAVSALTEAKGVDLETMVDSYSRSYEKAGKSLARAQVMDEIVADATEGFLNDPDYINRIVKENRTLGEKILDFLNDMIDALKSMMQTGSKRKAAKGLEESVEKLEICRNYWMSGIQEGGDRYQSGKELSENTERFALEKPDEVTEEKIEENYIKVNEMEPVISLTGNEFQKGTEDLITRVNQFYQSIGGVVHNDVIGDIYLTRDSVKDDMGHGIGRVKAITFAAVPDVLKEGHVLNYEKNWKNRNYDSAVIGAKVNISDGDYKGDYYEVAIVKVMDDNRMYLHEVYATKMEGLTPFKTPGLPKSNTRSDAKDLPSIYSIFEKLLDVNTQEKDSKKSADIRFQLEDVEDYEGHIIELMHENEELKEANNLLHKQFKLTSKDELRQQDIHKVAYGLLKKYNSTYSQDILDRNMTKLYEYIRSADSVDGKEVSAVAADIARAVLKNSKQIDTALTEQYKELRNQIRNTAIQITDQDKADLAEAGGYNNFRKKYFGRMKLGNSGISVDSLYEELAVQHPELFDMRITHPADRLMQVGNVLDITQEQIRNPYHADMDEMSYIVGQELLDAYFDIRQAAPTFADKKAHELDKARKQYKNQLNRYKEKTVTRYEALLAERDRDLQSTKDMHKKEIAVQQAKFNEQIQKRRDSLRSQNAKKRIIKEVGDMRKWLLSPTDIKHIPENMRVVVADFLNNIDFSSRADWNGVETQRTNAWNEASRAFQSIIKSNGVITDDDGNVHYIDLDPDMVGRLDELIGKVKGIQKMEELDVYSLEELLKTVTSMKKAITEVNQMKSNSRYREISLLAEDIFRDVETVKDRTEYLGVIGKMNDMVNYDMLDPLTVFGHIGDSFSTLYESLRIGLDNKTRKIQEAETYFQKSLEDTGMTKKEVRKWTGISAETKEFKTSGGTIELSMPQIMSLYALDKRGQARKHMYDRTGGIKASDLMEGTSFDNKKLELSHKKVQKRPVRVTSEDVRRICGTLSEEQRMLADSIQSFMGNQIAVWGNESTMEMYGYEKFTAKDYFPITTDKNYTPKTEDGKESTIKNLGMTKSTNNHANNPIIIEDIFDVFTRQVDQMSSYNAYVLPLSDLHKIMNYKDMRGFNDSSIQEMLKRTFGEAGVNYIDKLVKDINGGVHIDSSLWDKLLSNMKTAAVAGNLRVAIQQPTAIVRASAEIDMKYLIKSIGTLQNDGVWEEVCKYAPIAQWKDWGFHRMQTSRQLKDILIGSDSAKQRFVNKTMVAAEFGDKIAWVRLWNACKLECMDSHPNLEKNSEEFLNQAGKRFSEIVDKTQVVDSIIHRTQVMRDQSGFAKTATSFMGEPLKGYNMLYRAVSDIQGNKSGAKKKAGRTVAAYAASGFFTAAAAAILDAIRDDERDKKWSVKYLDYLWKNIQDNLNVLNNIPFAKDVFSITQGYTPARAELSGAQDLYYAWKKIEKLAKGEGKYTAKYVVLNTAQAFSKITGIPIKNITRDVGTLLDTAINACGGEADYEWLKLKYDIGQKENRKMYAGMMLEQEMLGNVKLARKIRGDMLKAGSTEEEIQNSLNTAVNSILEDTVDILAAVEDYSVSDKASRDTFKRQIDAYIEIKELAGWDKEKCLSQIRSMITAKYKPLWKAAKKLEEREAIIKKCKSLFYGGDSIYKDYNFKQHWKDE